MLVCLKQAILSLRVHFCVLMPGLLGYKCLVRPVTYPSLPTKREAHIWNWRRVHTGAVSSGIKCRLQERTSMDFRARHTQSARDVKVVLDVLRTCSCASSARCSMSNAHGTLICCLIKYSFSECTSRQEYSSHQLCMMLVQMLTSNTHARMLARAHTHTHTHMGYTATHTCSLQVDLKQEKMLAQH